MNLDTITQASVKGSSPEELKTLLAQLKDWHVELNNVQNALKINANSCFGALGSPSCMWFNRDIAEAITISGQYTVRNASDILDGYLRKIVEDDKAIFTVYNDTDSSFLTMKPLVEKFMVGKSDEEIHTFVDTVCSTKLKKLLQEVFEKQRIEANCTKQRISMKRENIANKAIFVKSKNYILNVVNKEGGIRLQEPKPKIVGIQSVRTDSPMACRKKITEAINLIFSKDEKAVIEFIDTFRKEFKTLPLDQIAKPIGANGFKDWYDESSDTMRKSIPIQLRASITFNKQLHKLNLTDRYQPILEGDKVKYLYLKTPNTVGQNVIAFKTELPEAFDIHQYIDFDTQFEKGFISPVKRILDTIGWQTEKVPSVMDLFS